MKVLLVNKFHYMKGGSERYYFTLASALKLAGHQVIFFSMKSEKNFECPQSDYFVSNSSTDGSIKSKINMLLHMNYSKEAYFKMKKLCTDEKPDLVVLNLVHKQLTCSIIDAIRDVLPKTKIIWVMHDLICVCPSYLMLNGKSEVCQLCLDGNMKHCVDNKCVKNSKFLSYLSYKEAVYIRKHDYYNKIDLYISPSEFHKKMLEKGKFTNKKIVCLPNPLDTDIVCCSKPSFDGYYLFLGRLSKEKGIMELVYTFSKTNKKLVVLGDGPLKDDLFDYVKKNKLSNVELKGFITGKELINYIEKSKFVIIPSICYENAPYSAMEAMAFGKPLIVSNLGGLPELVVNEQNGFVFNNSDELLSILNRIDKINEKKYLEMCNKSFSIAKQRFDSREYVSKLLKLVEE